MLLHRPEPRDVAERQRRARGLRKLEWLVVKDNWLHETATFWYNAPEVKSGEVKTADIKTEVFFFPSAQVAEYEGSFTNTQRMLQWHFKAAEPPGDCRTDLWFTLPARQAARRSSTRTARRRATRASRTSPGIRLRAPTRARSARGGRAGRAQDPARRSTATTPPIPTRHLAGFGDLKDDGSTTCASWIYCGVFPAPGQEPRRQPQPDPPGHARRTARLGVRVAGEPAHHVQPRVRRSRRASPWSERKRWIWWDAARRSGSATTCRTSRRPRRRTARANPDAIGLDALSGDRSVHHEGRTARAGSSSRPGSSTVRSPRTTSRPSRR